MEEERIHNSASPLYVFPGFCCSHSTRVALFYLVGLFDLWDGIQTLFISAGGAYLIAAKMHSPYMPWIGFVFLMGHMSINHIFRQMANDASLVDISGMAISSPLFTHSPPNPFTQAHKWS